MQVKIAGVDPFNGWDIQIESNQTVIKATTLSIAGNVLAANYSETILPAVNCINGINYPTSHCDSSDGPGIVHSAAVGLQGTPPTGPVDGLLFTINYTVVGSGSYTPLLFLRHIVTNGPTAISVSTRNGIYGIAPVQGFKLIPSPNSTSIRIGSKANITLTISSFGGYSGTVDLTLITSQSGLLLSLNVSGISLSPSRPSHVNVNVVADPAYPQASITITVTGTSSGLQESTTVSILTLNKPDFIFGVSPSILKIHATDSGSSIVTLDTDSGFSGSIHLKMDVPPVPGLIAFLGATDFTISPGKPGATVFAVRTPPSDFAFIYKINITASSQSLTHMPLLITVKSPSPDFAFQMGGSGYVVQAGQSRSYTLTMTSVDYFKGKLFLIATSLSGIKEVFSRPFVALDFGNSSTSLMTITTDAYLAPGNHIINMTALGTTFLGGRVNHTITTTITVVPVPIARTIIGLQPLAYFGIVGALWLGIIGAAIREIRRPKPKRLLS